MLGWAFFALIVAVVVYWSYLYHEHLEASRIASLCP